MMVRETGQSEVQQAARRTVVGRSPGTAILNETEILERAACHFRLRTQGDLDSVVTGVAFESPDAGRESEI
jgi:hypothetical protein